MAIVLDFSLTYKGIYNNHLYKSVYGVYIFIYIYIYTYIHIPLCVRPSVTCVNPHIARAINT